MSNVLDYTALDYLGRALHTAESHAARGGGAIRLDVDAVVVGSGPGGMVTAMVLAEGGLRVAVIEDGRFWPKGSFKRQQSYATKHMLQDRGTRFMTGNAFIPVTSGRGVGGGTLVNSAICFRGPDYVLDEWVQDWGLEHFGADQREGLFEEIETALGVAPTPMAVAGMNSLVTKRGFEKLGVPSGFMPRNAPGCVGCGTCQTGCPTGGKATADLVWLPRVLRAGGQLYADSRVEEILIEGGRAVGIRATMRDVESEQPVASIEVRAARVILAAGAINTPMLLQAQKLANSSGMVGRNLRVHPTSAVLARFEEEIKLWTGATQGYFARHPDDREVLLETFSAPPEVFMVQAAAIGSTDFAEFLREFRHVAACGLLVRDHSSGTVTRGDEGRPKISYNVGHRDRQKMTKGMLLISDMFFAAGARSVMPVLHGSQFYLSRNAARDQINKVDNPADMSMYSSHPMGTCRLGADPKTSVARAFDGRTHDVEGLYITDSSLFPTALGANPQITIMAQSLALARNILKS
ncbi:MAG: GMC family oxidoreductase [Bradymonadaceae bacterium]|nr:GMC family oxidoreductase [Lujinxingiaceae bacterium]